jgi:hypothetical protein
MHYNKYKKFKFNRDHDISDKVIAKLGDNISKLVNMTTLNFTIR